MAGLVSLASALASKASRKTRGAFLMALDEHSAPTSVVRFQYFPETLSDSKNVNYQQKEIPGGSLPLYQWIASGERVVSFTVMFSSDVDLLTGTPATQDAGIASQALLTRLKNQGLQGRNPDIRAAVAWLRQYLFPSYVNALTVAPPHLSLFIPGSGIGTAGGNTTGASGADSIPCVMTQCEVSWDAYFPSGLPRLASVQLAFAQIPQVNGAVVFPTSASLSTLVTTYTQSSAFQAESWLPISQ